MNLTLNQRLNDAAMEGNLEGLKALMAEGADPKWKGKINGWTSLMVAARLGHEECVKELLPHSDPLARDAAEWTALMHAAYQGETECVKALVSASNLNDQNQYGWTALMMALRECESESVKSLLDGSDMSLRDSTGATALMMAVQTEDKGIVSRMIELGADVNARDDNGDTALTFAVSEDRFENARLLLEKGADPSLKTIDGNNVFHSLNTRGSGVEKEEFIRLLMDAGVSIDSVNDEGETLLMRVVQSSNEDFALRILKMGARADIKNARGDMAEEMATNQGLRETLMTWREAEAFKEVSKDNGKRLAAKRI